MIARRTIQQRLEEDTARRQLAARALVLDAPDESLFDARSDVGHADPGDERADGGEGRKSFTRPLYGAATSAPRRDGNSEFIIQSTAYVWCSLRFPDVQSALRDPRFEVAVPPRERGSTCAKACWRWGASSIDVASTFRSCATKFAFV